jgi:hypothetical protein
MLRSAGTSTAASDVKERRQDFRHVDVHALEKQLSGRARRQRLIRSPAARASTRNPFARASPAEGP